MTPFDIKAWLDQKVIPLLAPSPPIILYSVLTQGSPVRQVLVFTLVLPPTKERIAPRAVTDTQGPDMVPVWGMAVKRLLEAGLRFDYTREATLVELEGNMIALFGSDGTPHIEKSGMVSVRLFRKEADAIELLLQVGTRFSSGALALAATKNFFALFEEDPVSMVKKYGAPWGGA